MGRLESVGTVSLAIWSKGYWTQGTIWIGVDTQRSEKRERYAWGLDEEWTGRGAGSLGAERLLRQGTKRLVGVGSSIVTGGDGGIRNGGEGGSDNEETRVCPYRSSLESNTCTWT